MAALDTMKNMGTAKLTIMAMATILMIGFFVMLMLKMSSAGMVPLYTSLSLQDSGKIVAELEKAGVPYELTANGSQVMVPADRVLRMRMSMAEQGLPSGGSIVGYEIFDRSETFGSSSFVININMMRALEGELSRTIGSLAGIDTARVHLVAPKRELFTRDKEKPSASVIVKMRGGHTLERSEVTAILHLVASSVPGLEPSKVTVVDSLGRLLARGDGEGGMNAAGSNAEEFRIAYETRTQQTLEDLLEKVVGPGKVRVQVAADINFDRVITNSEKYDPEGQVARSTQTSSQREDAKDKSGKDSVSVANNLPGAAAGSEGGNSSNKLVEQTDETTNYEISKTVQNHIQEGGTVKKVSVAVLVDGNYTPAAEEGAAPTYAPRSEDEIKQLKTLIMSAIGYDEKRGDKIEVVNMRFSQEGTAVEDASFFERFKLEMQSIAQTLIIAVVAILAILLVLRPAVQQLIKSAQAPSARAGEALAALEGPGGAPAAAGGAPARLPAASMGGGAAPAPENEIMIDVANIKGGLKSSSMKKINEIVEKYPEETMGVLRQWVLKQS